MRLHKTRVDTQSEPGKLRINLNGEWVPWDDILDLLNKSKELLGGPGLISANSQAEHDRQALLSRYEHLTSRGN